MKESPRLRIGDVVGDLVVIGKRFHPVVKRIECLCVPAVGNIPENLLICLWADSRVNRATRSDLNLAASRLREKAWAMYRTIRRARKPETRRIHAEAYRRLCRQSCTLSEIAKARRS